MASCSSYKYSSVAENIVRTLKVRPFTTKVIKSHVKLHMKSNATKIPRESTPYITLFTARSRIFLPAAILRVALSWSPRKPTVFARFAGWQLKKEYLGWCRYHLLTFLVWFAKRSFSPSELYWTTSSPSVTGFIEWNKLPDTLYRKFLIWDTVHLFLTFRFR